MIIKTGITINELIVSFDTNNNPISAATFSSCFYINGVVNNSVNATVTLNNASAATFSVSWSASTTGMHQLYIKNNTTQAVYISEIYDVRQDNQVDPSPTIYVGL